MRGTQGRDEDRTEVMTIRDEVSGAGSLGSCHFLFLSHLVTLRSSSPYDRSGTIVTVRE